MRLILFVVVLLTSIWCYSQEDYILPDTPDMDINRGNETTARGVCVDVRVDVPMSTTRYKRQIDSLYSLVEGMQKNYGITKNYHIVYWDNPTPWRDELIDTEVHLSRYSRTMFEVNPVTGRMYDQYQLLTINGHGTGHSYMYGTGSDIHVDSNQTKLNYRTSVVDFIPNKLDRVKRAIAHHQGHNDGAWHTQSCFWNGDRTPIDGCVGPEVTWDELDTDVDRVLCKRIEAPEYWTIMGYCNGNSNIEDLFEYNPQVADTMRVFLSKALGECSTTSIDRINTAEIKVFPNPFTDNVNIEPQPDYYCFFSLDGKLVNNISFAPSGMYILRVTYADRSLNRIIVKH